MKLTVENVINWMNNWEVLKDTSIPLRFKEDFEFKEEQKALTLSEQKEEILQKLFSAKNWAFNVFKNHQEPELYELILQSMETYAQSTVDAKLNSIYNEIDNAKRSSTEAFYRIALCRALEIIKEHKP